MIKKNLFRTDSRPAPALWAALFHRDDKPAAAVRKREKDASRTRKPAADDSAESARERMIRRGMERDEKDDGSRKIQKNYGGTRIDK